MRNFVVFAFVTTVCVCLASTTFPSTMVPSTTATPRIPTTTTTSTTRVPFSTPPLTTVVPSTTATPRIPTTTTTSTTRVPTSYPADACPVYSDEPGQIFRDDFSNETKTNRNWKNIGLQSDSISLGNCGMKVAGPKLERTALVIDGPDLPNDYRMSDYQINVLAKIEGGVDNLFVVRQQGDSEGDMAAYVCNFRFGFGDCAIDLLKPGLPSETVAFAYLPTGLEYTGWFDISIRVMQNRIELFANGTLLLRYTDCSNNALTYGRVGVRPWGSTVLFRNFVLVRLPAGAQKYDCSSTAGSDTSTSLSTNPPSSTSNTTRTYTPHPPQGFITPSPPAQPALSEGALAAVVAGSVIGGIILILGTAYALWMKFSM